MTLELVEQLQNNINMIFIAIWQGIGFKNQLLQHKNIFILDTDYNVKPTDNEIYNKLFSKDIDFKIRVNCQGQRIIDLDEVKEK